MENAYGIGITNRFGCFLRGATSDSEEDHEELKSPPKQVKSGAEKENRITEATKAPLQQRKGIRDSNQKDAKPAPIKSAPVNDGQKSNRPPPRTAPASGERQTGLINKDEDREERNNRRNKEDGNRPNVDGDFGDRRGGRGGFRGERRAGNGGPRGGAGGGGIGVAGRGGGPRKREFDRQSGSDKSGVKSVDKRDGGGSRNWGNYKDDMDADTPLNVTTGGEENAEEKGDKEHADGKGDEKVNDGENETPNGPPEPKLMTLEEWKATQQPRQKPVFNLRKAGEGEDQTQWQNLTLKKKEKVVDHDEEEYEEEEDFDCPQRAGRQKQILEIDFHFTDSRRGGTGGERRGGRGRSGGGSDRGMGERGGDRGGRGGGGGGPRGGGGFRREGGGGGGFRGSRGGGGRDDRPTRQAAPRVDDVNDFPSLG